jgi:chromosome segregation ATPase
LYDVHQTIKLAENREHSFQLVSSNAFTQDMQELQSAKAECQHAIDEYKIWQQRLERLENQLDNQAQELQLLSSSSGEPLSEHTLSQHKDFLDSELLRLENQKRSLIRPKLKKDLAKDDLLRRLKLSDSKIIGRIVDLVLVKDRKYINFVSFLCQGIIDAVVTQDLTSSGQVFDANLKTLPLDCVPPTMPLQFPSIRFPDPKDPEQFIEPQYIVSED